MITVEAVQPSLPVLAGPRWAILRAHARALSNRLVVAHSPWGVAVALEEMHERNRPVWVIHVPSQHQQEQATGVFTCDGADRRSAAAALLSALRQHARELGVQRMVVARCPEGDRALAEAVAELGGRAIPITPDYVVESCGSFEDHLRGLSKKRGWKLRQDLGSAQRIGAHLHTSAPPSAGELDAAWAVVQETLARKQPRLRWGPHNLLASLAAEAADSALTLLRDGDRLLGALFAVRSGDEVQFAYLGHIEAPPLHVSAALWATAIRTELERGTRRLLLGMTGDVLKRRLGARAVPQVHYYLAV
jgi:hypothetical protein